MKKLMSLMLGLTLLAGTATVASAQTDTAKQKAAKNCANVIDNRDEADRGRGEGPLDLQKCRVEVLRAMA